MTRRAFTMIEVILAVFLLLVGGTVLLSVFSSSSTQALQSRNRTVALCLAQTWMEEVRAHPYGEPLPSYWKDELEVPVVAWVEGNAQEMLFWKTITFSNQSFIGNSTLDTDEVTIVIEWDEGVGKKQTSSLFFPPAYAGSRARKKTDARPPKRPVPGSPHLKKLEVKVPVWR